MKTLTATVLDIAGVIIFVLIGRSVHGHVDSLRGMAKTSWPFLVGLLFGWIIARGWRSPLSILPTGVSLWLATVAIGMMLRAFFNQGIAVPFVLVSLGFFALTLLGWRTVALLINRLRVPPT
ncbi:MAG: DUF3054 domain-containing protein [Ferrimicrobium sp.]